MSHLLPLAVALRSNRITAILLGLLLAIAGNALAQPTLSIGTNTRVVGTGAVQLVYGGGALTNTGSLSLAAGQLSATGPTTYGGSGAATVANVSFGHSTGSSRLNSLLSVTGRATLSANTALNANGQLYLRTDQFPNADLVNNGILTGTVQGLVTRGTVLTGSTPYNSVLSHNVSGTSARYQWQSSADNSVWTDVPGATAPTYTANVSATTYYRCLLTTSNSNYDQATPALLLNFTGSSAQPIRYVKTGGTGDGSSWANASGDLQAMIYAISVEQVWVAGGLYKPLQDPDDSDSRSASFRMRKGVAIYGGFVGTETTLNARPAINPFTGRPSSTTLSGDIGTPGVNNDNCYHVIINTNNIDNTVVLDGFVIADGNANGAGTRDKNGGGLYNDQSSPALVNCSLVNNLASGDGGGIYNSDSSPMLTNCSLLNNSASKGGGMANTSNSSPRLTNCSLLSNTATNGGGGGIYNNDNSNPLLYNSSLINNSANKGGAIYAKASSPVLINCSLLGNSVSATLGGGFYIKVGSNPTLANCVLWSNGAGNTIVKDESSSLTATYSLFDNTVTGYTGTNNKTTTTSPFASANPGTPASVALAANSPAIDAGSDQAYGPQGPQTDLVGNPRFSPTGGRIDMGAIEFQTTPVTALSLVLSASPTTILTTGTTTLSATVSGGTSPYSYTFSGPGTISQSPSIDRAPQMGTNGALPPGNTATVSGLSPGVQTFTVVVTDDTSPTSQTISGTVSVTVNEPNTAPVATVNANQTATVGTAFTYTVNAFTDAQTPASLTYSASINPANGLTFNPATRVISGTPTAQGVSSVTITATDPGSLSATTSFTITVGPRQVTALVATLMASPTTILTTGTTTLSATVSGGTMPYSYTFSGPGTITPAGNTATVSGLTAGVKNFTLTVRDSSVPPFMVNADLPPAGQITTATVSVTVNEANTAPVATSNNNQTATVGAAFTYTVNAFADETPNSLTYTASIVPANGFSFDAATRIISGTPSTSGVSTVTLSATDPGSLSATTSFTITVSPAPVTPTAPFAITGVAMLSCTPVADRINIAFDPQYAGRNGSPISFSVANELAPTTSPGPYTLSLYRDNPVITLRALQSGVSTSFAYNWLGACSSLSTTPGGNTPPTLANAIPPQSATVGQGFSYVIPAGTFTDAQTPNALVLSVAGLPTGLAFTAPATISGTPSTSGVSTVTVTATDPGSLSASTTFTLTVSPASTTGTPTPTGPFAITGVTTASCVVMSGSQRSVTFTPQYAGRDGSPISFSVANELAPTTAPGPYTLSLYTDNPVISLRAVQNGVNTSFAYNWLSACNSLSTTPGNTPPTLANAIPPQSATVGQGFSYAIPAGTFTDAQTPNALVLSVAGLPAGLAFTAPATISGTPSTSGVSTLTVTATDPGSLSVSTTFTITVSPASTTGTPTPTAPFAITSVTTIRCVVMSGSQRSVTFTPQYSGLNGQPLSFSVVNELATTTSPGPYTLRLYTDNPTITLRATQAGTPGVASFSYDWLSACGSGSRLGATAEAGLQVVVRGNPVTTESVAVEIRGAQAQPLRLAVLDQRGYPVSVVNQESAADVERVQVRVGSAGGLYFLQVSTPTQTQTIKLLKQ